jgi:hypothetical protein
MPITRVGLEPWGKGIPMIKSDEVVARFTRRAEKLRGIASNVKDREVRDAMLLWAADYDRLADRAIQLPSPLMQNNRSGGAPVAKSPPALPARELNGDSVHSIDRPSSKAAQRSCPDRRLPVVHHRLGYGLTAALAFAVVAHILVPKRVK